MFKHAILLSVSATLVAPASAQKSDRPKDDKVTAQDVAIKQIDEFLDGKGKPKKGDGWRSQLVMPPKLEFSEDMEYRWLVATNKGDITIRLMPEIAPMHVSSTIYLARAGFYDDLIFHRVITDFMAQGGCPLGKGTGGPGYTYDGETDPKVKHDRPGLLSMANTGRPRSDGSQFFLTFVPTPWLDGKHTIFGEVIDGMDVLKALEKCGSPGQGKTSEKLTMDRTRIVVVPKPKPDEGEADKGGADKGGADKGGADKGGSDKGKSGAGGKL